MKLLKLSAYFILMAVMAMTFVSCEDDDDGGDPIVNSAPEAVTNMVATSNGSGTITMAFVESADKDAVGFAGYQMTLTNENGDTIQFTGGVNYLAIPTGNNSATVSGLSEGEIYTFSVTCAIEYPADEDNNVAAETKTSEAVTVRWSPASRIIEDIDGAEIKMYGFNSQFGSGIAIDDGDVYNVSVGAAESWLMAFCNKDGALTFGSAATSCYTPDNVGDCQLELLGYGASLDDYLKSESLDTENYKSNSWPLSDLTGEGNPIFAFRVQNVQNTVNYGKIMLVKNGDSYVYDAGTDDEYIMAIISYQNKTDVPYAEVEKKSSPSSN